jgi:hypothetical protein
MIMRAGKSSQSSAPKKKSGFVYKVRDPKTVRARAEQTSGQYDGIFRNGVDTWRPKNGENVIRFLPPTWHPHEHYGFDVWTHSYVGTGNGSYLCLDKMKGERCPICEAAAESAEAGEADESKKLKPTRKVLTWIIDRDDDASNPQIYMMSWSMDRDISNLADNRRSGEVLLLDHPDEGYDVSFKRTGQGINTRYIGIAIDRDSSPLSERQKIHDRIMAFIEENPLPDTLQYRSEDYLEKVIAGTAEEKDQDLDEDDDAEDDTKKSKKSSVTRTKRRVEKDDDGEEEGDEEDRPAKSKTKSKSRRDKDEEEDDDGAPFDTDEEEEEEKPRKSKRRDEEDEDEDETPRKSSKRRRDDDEDEEDEKPRKSKSRRDDDDQEEETEDEKPVRSKSKRKPVRDEEDEDDGDSSDGEESQEEGEEDQDEGEEEEEEPKRRVKPSAKKGRR